jgi:hypothetical protein
MLRQMKQRSLIIAAALLLTIIPAVRAQTPKESWKKLEQAMQREIGCFENREQRTERTFRRS